MADTDPAEPNPAEPNSGEPNPAEPDSGEPNAGEASSADPNSGETDSAQPDSGEPNAGEANNDTNRVNNNAQSNDNDEIQITREVITLPEKKTAAKRKAPKPGTKSKRSKNRTHRNKKAKLSEPTEIISIAESSDEEAEQMEVQVEIERVPVSANDSAPVSTNDSAPVSTNDSVPVPANDSAPVSANDSVPVPANDSVPVPANDSVPEAGTQKKPRTRKPQTIIHRIRRPETVMEHEDGAAPAVAAAPAPDRTSPRAAVGTTEIVDAPNTSDREVVEFVDTSEVPPPEDDVPEGATGDPASGAPPQKRQGIPLINPMALAERRKSGCGPGVVINNLPSGQDIFSGFADLNQPSGEELLIDVEEVEEVELIQMHVLSEFGRRTPRKRRGTEISEIEELLELNGSPFSLSSRLSGLSQPKLSKITCSPGSKGSRKSYVDLNHPKFLLPFEYGWKREVVTRSITSREDGISKDVYYFHPAGKKLRSLREVSERLTPGLTSDNFTFYKEPLGIDPEYEIVRNARSAGQSPSTSSAPSATPVRQPYRPPSRSYSHPSTSPRGRGAGRGNYQTAQRESPESPFLVPPPRRRRTSTRCNRGTPRIALRQTAATCNVRPSTSSQKVEGPKPHPDAPSGPRRKITPRKNPPTINPPAETTVITGISRYNPANWTRNDEKSTIQEGEQDYCTIRCANAVGLIPTLQCSICLCIYHPDCCDMDHITSVFASITYICENCQAKSTDLSERGLVKNISPERVTCEKSPPIISPKPIHPPAMAPVTPSAPSASTAPIPSAPSTALVPLGPRIPRLRPRPSSSSGAGGVTPWFPPPRRVRRSPNIPASMFHRPEESSSPPQSIINLNYKRYIVVPKHRVLPFVPPVRNSPPARPECNPSMATIITPTPTSTIIEGPPLQNNPFVRMTGAGTGVLLIPFTMGENPMAGSSSSQYFLNPLADSSTVQRSLQPDLPIGSGFLDYFMNRGFKRTTVGVDESMQKFMRNICTGYTALLHVFQYLKVQELLRAGRVCRLWRDIAGHPSLWRIVRMKNSQVCDWKGFTEHLVRHETKFLDLRKMLVTLDESEEMWGQFTSNITSVTSLEGLEMCRCSVDVIEQVIEACPQLQIFNAQMIGMRERTSYQKLNLAVLTQMRDLHELRVKSCYGLSLSGSLSCFSSLKDTLTVFSMTSIRNLSEVDVYQIGKLVNLQNFELGECTDLPKDFPAVVIAKLKKLKRVRFEKGPSHWSANDMLKEMKNLKHLVQLELINFDIRTGFDDALAACTNLKKLLLIPTYVTQSATTNHIVLSGAYRMWDTLTHFTWVLTVELLKVTELFVDQCDGKPTAKKSGGNSVPILKPVPVSEFHMDEDIAAGGAEENATGSRNATPITVIHLEELTEMVKHALPHTRVKLLKIPFQNTWRQSFVEGSV